MQLLCLQLDIAWEDKRANHARVRALVEEAAPEPGSLVVLPEMFATGFSMSVGSIAEPPAGESQRFLARLAREHRVCVLGGIASAGRDGRGSNECVVYSAEGEEIARYAKLHPFAHGGEDRHYSAGHSLASFPWAGFEVAPFICYDLRFPEVFRRAVRRGATLLVVIANWPAARGLHWTTLLRARAIENQAYVVGVNRCGRDPNFEYPGRSMVVGPDGELVAEAADGETVIRAEPDPAFLRRYREQLPFLRDMRGEFVP
jgi:omega-amidase